MSTFTWILVIGWSSASANPASLLAPTPGELEEAEAELTERVLRAEAIGRAASRLQNAAYRQTDPCENRTIVRARSFADAWRDAAQRARVQGSRTQILADSPTLTPIMSAARRERIEDLAQRADLQARSWFEFDQLELRSKTTCEAGDLSAAAGLRSPTPIPRGQEDRPVAVLVARGALCPGARRVRGVIVVSGPVCVDDDPSCSCQPTEVLPGAVLAP